MRRAKRVWVGLCLITLMVIGVGCTVDDLVENLGAVRGTVTDRSGALVSSALVTVQGTSYAALTNGEGQYVLNLPKGSHVLVASKEGLGSCQVEVNIDVTASGTNEPVLANFTLDGTGGGPITPALNVRLETSNRTYYHGTPMQVRLVVENRGNTAVRLGGGAAPWEIQAWSEEGWQVWSVRANAHDEFELPAGAEKVFEARWQWYTHPINHPVVVMLEGHVNPVFPTPLPLPVPLPEPCGTDQNAGDDEVVNSNAAAIHEECMPYVPGYVTEPIYVKLHPEGHAEPIYDPLTDPCLETQPGQCAAGEPASSIEPWEWFGKNDQDIVHRPRCWRKRNWRRLLVK